MQIIRHAMAALALGALWGLATPGVAQDDPPGDREPARDAAGAKGDRAAGGVAGQAAEPGAKLVARPGAERGGEEAPRKFEGFYWRGGAGLMGLSDSDYRAPDGTEREVKFDPGFVVSTAIGYDFGSVFQPRATPTDFTINLRSEVEYSFERVDVDDPGGPGSPQLTKLSSYGFALNGYLDFDTPTAWTFYTGFGVGAARIETEGAGFSARDTTGFVQLMGGAIFDVNRYVSLYAGLRSRGYSDFDVGDSTLDDLASGTLEVGLMLSF